MPCQTLRSQSAPLVGYSFEGSAGDEITLQVTGVSLDFNPELSLLSPMLVTLASAQDSPGGFRPSDALLRAVLPEDGLYTLSVFGVPGAGQRWMADGCRKCVVCPSSDPQPRWRVVLSGRFHSGKHLFAANLGPDTAVQRIRLERKKDSPADYVAAVERLGLELGPSGPVTRERAEEARRFLERRRLPDPNHLWSMMPRALGLAAVVGATVAPPDLWR